MDGIFSDLTLVITVDKYFQCTTVRADIEKNGEIFGPLGKNYQKGDNWIVSLFGVDRGRDRQSRQQLFNSPDVVSQMSSHRRGAF
jgi:hypothetical protein